MASSVPWSASQTIPGAAPGSGQPAAAVVGETLHLVWSYNRMLYHAWRANGTWSQPIPVAIGEQPALAAGPDGQLHCLFVNYFLRNYEIYHVSWAGHGWTLPVNASLTYGASQQPALVVGDDGTLHAAWADATPGYSTIYYGTRGASFWANRPVPSGRGVAPALAVAADGTLYIAWADRRRDTGVYDVFCCVYRDGLWYPPEAVSDSADADSCCPQLAVDARGVCHVIWGEARDGACRIFHAARRPTGWTVPADLSQADADCSLARLVANPAGFVHAIWSDGWSFTHCVKPAASDAAWRAGEPINLIGAEVSGLAPALSASRRLYLVWAGFDQTQTQRLFWIEREPFPRFSVFMPIIARQQR